MFKDYNQFTNSFHSGNLLYMAGERLGGLPSNEPEKAKIPDISEKMGVPKSTVKKMVDYGIKFEESGKDIQLDVSGLKVATLWNDKLQTGVIKAPILLKNLPKNAATSLTQYKDKEVNQDGEEVDSQFGESLSLYINGDLFIFTKERGNFEKRSKVQVSQITSALGRSNGPEKNGVELSEKDLTKAEVAKELSLREELRKDPFDVLKKDLDYRLIDHGETVMKKILEQSDAYKTGDWKRLNKKFHEAFKELKGGRLDVNEAMAQRLLVHFQKDVFDQLRLAGDPSAEPDGKIGPYSLYVFAMYFKMKRPTKKPALPGNPRLAKLIQEDKKAAYDQYVKRFDMQGLTEPSKFEKRYEKIVTEKDYFDPEKASFKEWAHGFPVLKSKSDGEEFFMVKNGKPLEQGVFRDSEGKSVEFSDFVTKVGEKEVHEGKDYYWVRRVESEASEQYPETYDENGKFVQTGTPLIALAKISPEEDLRTA